MGRKDNEFDAIVIGSGISGGWAAKELCEKGAKTLVLERGRPVKHITDYPTAMKDPWDFDYRGRLPMQDEEKNPIVNKCYAYEDATKQFFVKDEEHPYVQEKPFDWIRGYQEGGKSLIWARQVQRWSDFEFEGPVKEGYAIDWPIRYKDVAPWYSHVEKFTGISGNRDGIPHFPDSEVQKAFEFNCVEEEIKKKITEKYPDRPVIMGRCAHLTEPQDIHKEQGRGQCQARHLCYRGCPFGGYFSSNSATLPWAAKTGNLTMRTHAVVESIMYDDAKAKATGVRVIDANTREVTEYFAKVVFVNAACLNSNLILLNSKSNRFPNGLGNDNGLLGRYVAFHNYRGNISAQFDGFEDGYYYGRRPTSIFMPSFRNTLERFPAFKGRYVTAFSAGRSGWNRGEDALGAELKERLQKPGLWNVFMMLQGETIPKYDNHVRLSDTQKDAWGIPQLVTSIDYDENDEKMLKDFLEQGKDMLEAAGCININAYDTKQAPGLDIHEMGGVRMGNDPETSLLNKHNQLHSVSNVYVTDGAAMTSTGCQNPSLTFMALAARAANHAVEEMKTGRLK
jgi:choline dehydrogenase-like flavoprotein